MSVRVTQLQRRSLDACASIMVVGVDALAIAGAVRMRLARGHDATPLPASRESMTALAA